MFISTECGVIPTVGFFSATSGLDSGRDDGELARIIIFLLTVPTWRGWMDELTSVKGDMVGL